MIAFSTETGSEYELNLTEKKIRRLTGTHGPTPRQGQDGEWRTFSAIGPEVPCLGQTLLIEWGVQNEDGSEQCTVTSPVTSVHWPPKVES